MSGEEPLPDLGAYDAVIAACRPVVWSERFQVPGLEETPVYPGSIVRHCEGCGEDIYVGPRAQALTVPHVLCCFICAAIAHGAGGALRSLGNPYQPKKP